MAAISQMHFQIQFLGWKCMKQMDVRIAPVANGLPSQRVGNAGFDMFLVDGLKKLLNKCSRYHWV